MHFLKDYGLVLSRLFVDQAHHFLEIPARLPQLLVVKLDVTPDCLNVR